MVYKDHNVPQRGIVEVNDTSVQKISDIRALSPMEQALENLITEYDSLLTHSQLGLCVYDITERKHLYCYNENHRMRPASCQKILTAVTALAVRGADYEYLPSVAKPGKGWCWDDKITQQMPWKDKKRQTLHEVLQPVMKKSDNMLAESIYALLSSEQTDSVITLSGHTPSDFLIVDGSGLSLYNYVSPRLLVSLLTFAYDRSDIFPELYAAMPIAGVDGTLSKRMLGTTAHGNVHAKTGTVEGVSSLSGYATAQNGHLLAFSIINQGIARTAHGKEFQDKVCIILTSK